MRELKAMIICRHVFLLLDRRSHLNMNEIARYTGYAELSIQHAWKKCNAEQFIATESPTASFEWRVVHYTKPNENGNLWWQYFLPSPTPQQLNHDTALARDAATYQNNLRKQQEAEVAQQIAQARAEGIAEGLGRSSPAKGTPLTSEGLKCSVRNKNHASLKAEHPAWANYDHVCGRALSHLGDHTCDFCDRSWTNNTYVVPGTIACNSKHTSGLYGNVHHEQENTHHCIKLHQPEDAWHHCSVEDCSIIWPRVLPGGVVIPPMAPAGRRVKNHKTVVQEVVVGYAKQEELIDEE